MEKNIFEKEEEWVRKVRSYISKKPCKLSDFVENVKVLTSTEKGSVSRTIIVIGDILGKNVVMKISYPSKIKYETGIYIEEAIYRVIIDSLLINTPCLVRYLGTIRCKEQLVLPEKDRKTVKKFISENKSVIDINTEPMIIFTEMSTGLAFKKWLSVKERSKDELYQVLFLIFYTLKCFQNIGLYHNDLHSGNIFIEEKELLLYFKLKNKVVKLKTRYLPKLYDYDQSSIFYPGVERNVDLDTEFCPLHTICNFPSKKRDTFTVIAYLLDDIRDYSYKKQVVADLKGAFNYSWVSAHMMERTFYPEDDKYISDLDNIMNIIVKKGDFEVLKRPPKNSTVFKPPKVVKIKMVEKDIILKDIPETYEPYYNIRIDNAVIRSMFSESPKGTEKKVKKLKEEILKKDPKMKMVIDDISHLLVSPGFYDISPETRKNLFDRKFLSTVYYSLSLFNWKLPVKVNIRQ
jgi:hypothetical protein